jgi:hypothetical protein
MLTYAVKNVVNMKQQAGARKLSAFLRREQQTSGIRTR